MKIGKSKIEYVMPERFENGSGFDKEVFASLLELLEKQEDKRENANRFTRISILLFVVLGAFFGFAVVNFGDGFDRLLNDNPALLVLSFVAIAILFVILALSRIFRAQQYMTGNKIVKVCRTLGMTDDEIEELTYGDFRV